MNASNDIVKLKHLADDIETILLIIKSGYPNENAANALISGVTEMSTQLAMLARQLRYDNSKDEAYIDEIPF